MDATALNASIPLSVATNKNTYTAKFSSKKAGDHKLNVLYNGKIMSDLSASIKVDATANAIDPKQSQVSPGRDLYIGDLSPGQNITFTLRDKYGNVLPGRKIGFWIDQSDNWEITSSQQESDKQGQFKFHVKWGPKGAQVVGYPFPYGIIVNGTRSDSYGKVNLWVDTPGPTSKMTLSPQGVTLDESGSADVAFTLNLRTLDNRDLLDNISKDLRILVDNKKEITPITITPACTGTPVLGLGDCGTYSGEFKITTTAGTHIIGLRHVMGAAANRDLPRLTQLNVTDPLAKNSTLAPSTASISDAGSQEIAVNIKGRSNIAASDIHPFFVSPAEGSSPKDYEFTPVTTGSGAGNYKFSFKHHSPVTKSETFVIGVKLGADGIQLDSKATITVNPQNLASATISASKPTIEGNNASSIITLTLPKVSVDISKRLSLFEGNNKITVAFSMAKNVNTYAAPYSTSVKGPHKLVVYYGNTLLPTAPSEISIINQGNLDGASIDATSAKINAGETDKTTITLTLPNATSDISSNLRLVDSIADVKLGRFTMQPNKVTTYKVDFSSTYAAIHKLSVNYDGRTIANVTKNIEVTAENNDISEVRSDVEPFTIADASPAQDIIMTLRDKYYNGLPNRVVTFWIDDPSNWEINPAGPVTSNVEGKVIFHVKWKDPSLIQHREVNEPYGMGVKTTNKLNVESKFTIGEINLQSDLPSERKSNITFDPPNPVLGTDGEAKVNFKLELVAAWSDIADDISKYFKIKDNGKEIPASIKPHCTGTGKERNCSYYSGSFTLHTAGDHEITAVYLNAYSFLSKQLTVQ